MLTFYSSYKTFQFSLGTFILENYHGPQNSFADVSCIYPVTTLEIKMKS